MKTTITTIIIALASSLVACQYGKIKGRQSVPEPEPAPAREELPEPLSDAYNDNIVRLQDMEERRENVDNYHRYIDAQLAWRQQVIDAELEWRRINNPVDYQSRRRNYIPQPRPHYHQRYYGSRY